MSTIHECRAFRSASLQQARALRAAIPRQMSAQVADLMRGEAERLEAAADEWRRRIERLRESAEA